MFVSVLFRCGPPAGGYARLSIMYIVYALLNKRNDKIYIGQTNDIEKRLQQHKDKISSRSYTARFEGDWELIYKEEKPTREEALIREKQLKSFRGRQFIRQQVK
jgi:putative endonuclease